MKIAIFSDTYLPQTNGVATVVSQSAKSLSECGHDVWIFTVSGQHKNLTQSPDDQKVTLVILPSLKTAAYSGERFTLPTGAAVRRLRKFNPDIIHSHTPFAVGWEAVLGAKILKTAFVGTHHTFYDHYLKHIKADYKWAKKLSWKYTSAYYNRCDLVLSPSQSLADAMTRTGLKKPVAVLPNPIETDLFRPCVDRATKLKLKKKFGLKGRSLVYMGRVSYEKNIDQVIRAFALALRKNPDLELMIIGDGPEKNNLERLSQQIGIANKVIFTGALQRDQDNLVCALQANDAFITASKSENMPMSVIEAISVGLPTIMVSEKGLVELTKDGVTGFLVKADDLTAMAEKIVTLCSDQRRLKKFSQESRVFALKYSKENVTNLLLEAYRRAIELNNNIIS
jgi:1,2-diacylglycerol 3-alpha-glucosyltransferase